MAETEPRIQVRVSTDLDRWLRDRTDRSLSREGVGSQLRMEVELWREHLKAELARVPLTVAEASCLADVAGGPMIHQPVVGTKLRYETEDSFALYPGSYGEKWGIDEGLLLDRLRRLGPTADHALCDALSRWWQDDLKADAAGFQSVGINITDGGPGTLPAQKARADA